MVPVALVAALLIVGCGEDKRQASAPITIATTMTDTTPRTTTTKRKSKKTKRRESTTKTPSEPVVTGPAVRIRVRNGLCTPDRPSTPANQAFTLVIASTDRAYEFTFEGKRTIAVPKGGVGTLRVGARGSDEPVLTLSGEPCAVIEVGSGA